VVDLAILDLRPPFESRLLELSLLVPFAGTAALLFGGKFHSGKFQEEPKRPVPHWPGILAVVLAVASLACSAGAAFATRGGGTISIGGGEWIPGLGAAVSVYLDWLSAGLLLLLDVIGLMVLLFSLGYMKEESDQRRYFGGLLFFIAMMKLLILAGSYLLLFAGWEGVGLASYLLIAYHFERPLAAHAATKAFIVNRIGDAGFILAIIALGFSCGSTDFTVVTATAGAIPHGTLVFICSMLAIGAVGKSAQFPLHVWLPDAMEGPTPVSALIHSATMVCAGVYLLVRSTPLLTLAPEVGIGISILGAVTALLGATVALAENDIKRVLAYSTISQVGFMFLALGIGAGRAGMYHIVTHAFFKSLLFLGAGAVIHSLHGEQNLVHMGGLRKQLPITFWCLCVGALTLAGIPGLAAFFSKDLILEAGLTSGYRFVVVVGFATSLITAIYAWRLISLTFLGETRGHHLTPHPTSPSMRIPLLILAACCVLVGWIFVPIQWHAWPIMLASSIVALLGVGIAWYFYVNRPAARNIIDRRFAPIEAFLRNRWYIDAVYEEHLMEGIVYRTAQGAAVADTLVVDGAVNATAWFSRQLSSAAGSFDSNAIDGVVRFVSATTRFFSWPFRAVQTGMIQTYLFIFLAGALAALGVCLSR
jgi:NADH-quinone oxidoreductase subunit L